MIGNSFGFNESLYHPGLRIFSIFLDRMTSKLIQSRLEFEKSLMNRIEDCRSNYISAEYRYLVHDGLYINTV